MTHVNNAVMPLVPVYGTANIETVAVKAEKNPPLLSEDPSGQARLNPISVAQGRGVGGVSVLSGGEEGRNKRSADQPDTLSSRAIADAEVAKATAFAALTAKAGENHLVYPLDVPVAPESTLGRWRTQLDRAFKAPGFLEWAKEQNLDTTHLTLNPSTGELTGTVDGNQETFSLADLTGWADISRTLLSIAKVIAPEPGQTLYYPWPEGKVPLREVGRFYNQPVILTTAQADVQRKKLDAGASFVFGPTVYASQRSPEALAKQLTELGDEANTHALIKALESQADDATGRVKFSKVMVPIDPDSRYFRQSEEPRSEVSVAELLDAYDLHDPKNAKEARNLASSLSFDLAHRAPREDRGCAPFLIRSSNPTALSAEAQTQVRQIVAQWKAQSHPVTPTASAGPGADCLMGRLLLKIPKKTRQAIKDNPAAALDEMIRLPEAKALGKKIQETLGGVETPTSAIEYFSAALALDLDPATGASRHNLAGYNMYDPENMGLAPAEIKKRFIRHLEGKVGVEMAPMAAHLLLSVSAPEFLVNDLPPNVLYGSILWQTYSFAALRIEKQVPGAVAFMTYSQVILFGQTDPVSTEEIDHTIDARRGPVLDWAAANEVIPAKEDNAYSVEDYSLAVKALIKQENQLAWARNVLVTKPPTRKEIALSELKRVFGEGIDFEKEVIKDNHDTWPFNYSYSLVDIYMSGELSTRVWESSDEKAVPYDKMRQKFHELNLDINKAFDTAFSKYQEKKEEATSVLFRYHLSLMPKADQEILNNSDISFWAVRRNYDGENYVTRDNHERYVPNGEPSPQEAEALTGRHGVLMQADRGNGVFDYYSYFPLQGKVVKEPRLTRPLVSSPQKPWAGPLRNDRGDVLHIDDNPYHGAPPKEFARSRVLVERLAPPNTDRSGAHQPSEYAGGLKGSYFSKRYRELGSTVSHHFLPGFEQEKMMAKGVTEREQERITNKKLNEFFLSLAPFHDGIKAALNGNVSGATLELGFDIFGFLIPGAGSARKALKAGRGLFKAIASGVVKGAASSFSFDDVLSLPKNIRTAKNALGRQVGNLAPVLPQEVARKIKIFDPQKKYKNNDVVRRFYYKASGSTGEMKLITAIFLYGGWYAYNTITKTPHGVQLLQEGVVAAVNA